MPISPPIKFRKMFDMELVELDKLKPHEGVDSVHLRELKKEIKGDGILKFAIAINKNRNIILDGHHRVAALKELGCTKIPAIFVDYSLSNIEVQSQKNGIQLTKDKIIRAGLSLKKLPPKTSKHMIKIGNSIKHISVIEKRVNIPLEKLKEKK
jgi:ParB-like chromosome segregation protein Spo0J